MRLYVIVTGSIFALVVIAHVARMITEDASLASDPIYLLITACAAGLSVWSCLVLRRPVSRSDNAYESSSLRDLPATNARTQP